MYKLDLETAKLSSPLPNNKFGHKRICFFELSIWAKDNKCRMITQKNLLFFHAHEMVLMYFVPFEPSIRAVS